MKKEKHEMKFFAMFLAVIMVFTLLPITSFADGENNYLTFTAEEAGSTVTFGYFSGTDVMYSLDGGTTWTDCPSGTTITLENVNDTVSFKGNGVETSGRENCHFSMTGKLAASGDVTSLTNSNGGNATLTFGCYQYMFYGCTSLTTAPALPATTLAVNCYLEMFKDCTSLTTAPTLPATNLASCCYSRMFGGCTSLTTAPALPATTLAYECYEYMFYGCTNLKTAPALPAKSMEQYCYSCMFRDCTSLTTAPELPATTLAYECYYEMFYGCTSLKTAPALPATTLAYGCYFQMFFGCTSLKTAPALPATTLEDGCYEYMFKNCTSLTTPPVISATTFGDYCCKYMFSGCSNLIISKDNGFAFFTTPSDTSNKLTDMFVGTSGDLEQSEQQNPTASTTYYYKLSLEDCEIADITNQTYTGSAIIPEVTVTLNNATLIQDTDYTVTCTDINAGQATATITGIGKYTGTKTANFTISPKQLTVTGSTADGKEYDGTTAAAANLGTVSGIVSGDTDAVTVDIASAVFADKNVGNGKDVTITYSLSGDKAANYTVPADSITVADIERKQLSVIDTTVSDKTYDGTTTATAICRTVDGIITGDDVTVSIASAAFADSAVGTNKEVTVTYSLSGADAGNYSAPANSITTANIVAAASPADDSNDTTPAATTTTTTEAVTTAAADDTGSAALTGDTTINISFTVYGDKAVIADISRSAVNSLIAAGTADTLLIDVSAATETIRSVSFSKETFKMLSEVVADKSNSIDSITVKTTHAVVEINASAMEAVLSQATGSDIQLTVLTNLQDSQLTEKQQAALSDKETALTFEAYFMSNGQRIGSFNGGAAILSFSFRVPVGKDAKYYHVYYLQDDGTMTPYATRYNNGRIEFTANHFSDYCLIYDESFANDTAEAAAPALSTYTIKNGDCFWSIARKLNLNVIDLMNMNSEIAAQKYIYAGQMLTVIK